MTKMTKMIALAAAVLASAVFADTPLVQALKVEQKIQDVMVALHDAGSDA